MRDFLDYSSFLAVGSLSTLTMGFLVGAVVLRRRLYRLNTWFFANLAIFFGFLTLLFRDLLPGPVSIALLNGLGLYSLGSFVATSESLLGGEPRVPVLLASEGATVVAVVVLSFVSPERWPRVVVISGFVAVLSCYAALSIVEKSRRAKIRNGPGTLSLMFGIGAFFFLFRALAYAVSRSESPLGIPAASMGAVTDVVIVVLFTSFDFALLVILMARVEREVTGKVLELGESRNNLQILYDAFAETAGSIDFEELIPRLLDLLNKRMHVDAAVLHLLDTHGGELVLAAQRGLSPEALEALVDRQQGTILSERAFEEARAVVRPVSEFPEGALKEALGSLGISVFAGFPIIDRGETLGSLGVAFKDAANLDEARTVLFETMARQLGAVVRAATLHAELERANARLDILASTDTLTHLSNRRTALRVIEREIARSKRLGTKIAVLMCDIDHFKLFNDRHGHDCGDYVLLRTATLIAESLRSTDLASRWGGEEFLVILGNADPDGVLALAERVRRNVESAVWDYSGQRLSVTITLGVSICPPEAGADAIIAKADDALYEGKNQGRNRVAVHRCEDEPAGTVDSAFQASGPSDEPLELLPSVD